MDKSVKEKVKVWYNEGVKTRQIAERLGFSHSYIRAVVSNLRKEGHVGRRWREEALPIPPSKTKQRNDELDKYKRFYDIVESMVDMDTWDAIIETWEEE